MVAIAAERYQINEVTALPLRLVEYTASPEIQSPRFVEFCTHINRPDLLKRITRKTPIVDWTMEIDPPEGGLGHLEEDKERVAEDIEMPLVVMSLAYTKKKRQELGHGGQHIAEDPLPHPLERGFERAFSVDLKTRSYPWIPVEYFYKLNNNVLQLQAYHKANGVVYQGEPSDDHRIWQDTIAGFAGPKALAKVGITDPAIEISNEGPAVFFALARLDQAFSATGNIDTALEKVRKKVAYFNHTVVEAVESVITEDQAEEMIIPNMENEAVQNWFRRLMRSQGGRLRVTTLAMELSGIKVAVSPLHAEIASRKYEDASGNKYEFLGVQNGVAIKDWWDSERVREYIEAGIIKDNTLPTEDYAEKIRAFDPVKSRELHEKGRKELRDFLRSRNDQYGRPINIPIDAVEADWARRIAKYKRPWLIFKDVQRLADILKRKNMHFIMAGKAHPNDPMAQGFLPWALQVVDENPILKERFHFIENYDTELARALARGGDICVNTPEAYMDENGDIHGTEASGTSPLKGPRIMITKRDGFAAYGYMMAKVKGKAHEYVPSHLEITGATEDEEAGSLYEALEAAADLQRDPNLWNEFMINEEIEYLPVASGGRMWKDTLNVVVPRSVEREELEAA